MYFPKAAVILQLIEIIRGIDDPVYYKIYVALSYSYYGTIIHIAAILVNRFCAYL